MKCVLLELLVSSSSNYCKFAFGMQVDSSGLNVYWTIFRSVLCDHFQVRRNIQENFGKIVLKWYIKY